MADILYALAELLAALWGSLLWPLLLELPPPITGATIAVALLMAVYKFGWNSAVEADYADDLNRAASRRRARLR